MSSTLSSVSSAARVLGAIIVVAGIGTAPRRVTSLAASAALAALILALCRPAPRALLRRGAAGLFAIAGLTLPLWFAGDPQGALLVLGRASCALLAALGLAAALRPSELGPALAALRAPRALSGVVETMLRQVTVIEAEGARVALALRLRGARGSALMTSAIGALLVRSVERAERVELAMHLRGYDLQRAAAAAALRASDAPWLGAAVACVLAVHALGRLG